MDGWIEWAGGECPVPVGTIVDVKYRDGEIRSGLEVGRRIGAAYWRNDGFLLDIVAYRVVAEAVAAAGTQADQAETTPETAPPPVLTPTLRDDFAMSALTGVIIQCSGDRADALEGRSPEQYFAGKAYAIADAMLEARGK